MNLGASPLSFNRLTCFVILAYNTSPAWLLNVWRVMIVMTLDWNLEAPFQIMSASTNSIVLRSAVPLLVQCNKIFVVWVLNRSNFWLYLCTTSSPLESRNCLLPYRLRLVVVNSVCCSWTSLLRRKLSDIHPFGCICIVTTWRQSCFLIITV